MKRAVSLLSLLVLAAICCFVQLASAENIMVHFVPHSHDDVGWLKTIDEYYEQDVRHIYNTVVASLGERADRKFIVVEMAYFTMWWKEATEAQKTKVFEYVENGQMEFVLGGWCMSDDATPTYSGTTNQMAEGHQFLKDTFNYSPRYGWQIDPFGLSSYYPTLFAYMGFNGHIINRIHYTQKNKWKDEKHMEFVWRGSKSLGVETEMFTHVLDSHYSFPSGYNFEKDEPITDTNIATKADNLVLEFKKRANWYRTRHLFIPGGDDFRWKDAYIQFENWDKLIDYINARSDQYGVEIHYATLDDYFRSVHAENVTWPVYETDFFPYADNADSYWTGYFTSRPELKGYVRRSASVARTTEVFSLASGFTSGFQGDPTMLLGLRHANSEVQHHDGVTGTMKENVLEMYNEHLDDGTDEAIKLQTDAFEYLAGVDTEIVDEAPPATLIKSGEMLPIIVSNSLGWSRVTYHRMFVDRDDLIVLDSNYNEVLSQINELDDEHQPDGTFELFFRVELPALGYSTYFLTPTGNSRANRIQALNDALPFENSVLKGSIEVLNGDVHLNVTNKLDGSLINFAQKLKYYRSYTGPGQPSGTYIFRPNGSSQIVSSTPESWYVTGSLVQQVWVKFDDTHKEVYRFFSNIGNEEIEAGVEIQFRVGVLDYDREVITHFTTSLESTALLSSDNNGIEMHQRPTAYGPIQANYYPLVAQAFLSDGKRQLTILSERAHGIGTDKIGNVEVMLHRRCSQDDWRGMGEPLDDQYIVEPTLILLFGAPQFSEHIRPRVSLQHQYRPSPLFGAISPTRSWPYRTTYSALKTELPPNIHILGFKTIVNSPVRWSEAILRLHHIYEKDGDTGYSQPTEIDLTTIFDTTYSVSEELDLTGTVPLAELPRLYFETGAITDPWYPNRSTSRKGRADTIQMRPMQIYTCKVTFE